MLTFGGRAHRFDGSSPQALIITPFSRVALASGTRIGSYEVVAQIGAGGMGEVYRARDTRLKREVALKILPDSFANDPERLARLQREAEVLASLNHPNIAAIHGLEEFNGTRALVMELVEGETLADRIAHGPIPVDEALVIAKQIAEALDTAHEQGIIHRDLKPANIKLRDDDTVKVLDFGLAKALEGDYVAADVSISPTISLAATRMGVILGTAAYMAPEQARGKAVDRRADIWAFGCVLYEMITGKRAFEGQEASDTLAAILRAEPDWATVPQRVQRLLGACLEKDRKKRLHAIADYQWLLATDAATASRPASVTRERLAWACAAVAILAAAAIGSRHFTEADPIDSVRRLSVPVPEDTLGGFAAISPDGHQVVLRYNAGTNFPMARQALDSSHYEVLAGSLNGRAPFWSPDSRFIGFFADGKLKIVRSTGGNAQILCDAGSGTRAGGTWNAGGTILFSTDDGMLHKVSAAGGPCSPVKTSSERSRNPVFLPDGRHFLYVGGSTEASSGGLFVAALDEPAGVRLLPDESGGIFVPSQPGGTRGNLVVQRQNRLVAQPFDSESLQVGDDETIIAEDASDDFNGNLSASAANDGTLLYISSQAQRFQMTWFDRTGKALGTKAGSSNQRPAIRLSPEDRRLAVSHDGALWINDLERDAEIRLANDVLTPGVWSPDGKAVAYAGTGGAVFVQDVGGGPPQALLQNAVPSDWSRDGRTLVYTRVDPRTQADIWIMSNPSVPGNDRKEIPFLQTEFLESQGRLSPDGHWMAYTSRESGQDEIFVRPFPDGSGKWRISTSGGREPAWRQDGTELFYVEGAGVRNRVMAVPVGSRSAEQFAAGVPKVLFEFSSSSALPQANNYVYSPAGDGSRFLARVQTAGDRPSVTLITNWRQLVTTPGR